MLQLSNLRHPELHKKPFNPSPRKPEWIRVKAPVSPIYGETKKLMRTLKLTTVCEEAACPNIAECWALKHATVMILGEICTRACAFCNVRTGKPYPVNPLEPENVGIMALKTGAIWGAGLDVFNGEPENIHPDYYALENVFLLPYIGSATEDTRDAMGFRGLDNLDANFNGHETFGRIT